MVRRGVEGLVGTAVRVHATGRIADSALRIRINDGPIETEARLRADRLANASRKVRDESMRVNAEFELIDHDPDA